MAAPEFVAGQARGLSGNVPQGNVDAADGVHVNADAAVLDVHIVHVVPNGLNVQGVLSNQGGAQFLFQNGDDTGSRAAGIIGFADSHNPLIRGDAHDNAVPGVVHLIGTGGGHPERLLVFQAVDGQTGNFHDGLLT